MPKQQGPCGLWFDFDPKVDDWGENVNDNFQLLDLQLKWCIIDMIPLLPGTAGAGDTYIDTTNNTIAVWYNGMWNTSPLVLGKPYLNKSDGIYYSFDGTNMAPFTGAPSISSTTGISDAGSIIKTDACGSIDGNFIPGIPDFASIAVISTFTGLPLVVIVIEGVMSA